MRAQTGRGAAAGASGHARGRHEPADRMRRRAAAAGAGSSGAGKTPRKNAAQGNLYSTDADETSDAGLPAMQKGTRVLISLWNSLMFGRVRGTRTNISEFP